VMKKDEIFAPPPPIRQKIREGHRGRAFTLDLAPAEPHAPDYPCLPPLSRLATLARTQIIAEALVRGNDTISYSRRHSFYTDRQRYYRETYSYRSIVPAVDQLAAAGLIEHEKMPPGHRGMQSRFRASQALLKEFAQAAVKYDPFETIILRDADGNPIDYRDNRETRRMRKNLAALNEALLSQQIGLGDQVIREGERIENGGRAELQMHRVFVRGRWDNCGRFVGPLWQSRPKTE